MENARGFTCPICGGELIWDCDYDFEDLGYEDADGRGGIVSDFHCPTCEASIEAYCPFPKLEDEESDNTDGT